MGFKHSLVGALAHARRGTRWRRGRPVPWALKVDAPRVGEFPTEDESVIRGAGMRGTGQRTSNYTYYFHLIRKQRKKQRFW